jgi:hypothetical protein
MEGRSLQNACGSTSGRNPDEPLFRSTEGRRLHPDNFIERQLKPILRKLGLDGASKYAKPVEDCYQSVIDVHLKPAFGSACLADLTRSNLQGYFASLAREGVGHPTLLKIRDTLSSILRSAVNSEFLNKTLLMASSCQRINVHCSRNRCLRLSSFLLSSSSCPNLTTRWYSCACGRAYGHQR